MADQMDYLSFNEPATAASARQFLTQSYTVFTPEGDSAFYTPGSSSRLELSGMSQNSFILPRTMFINYEAVSTIKTDQTVTPSTVGDVLIVESEIDLRGMPGCPFYGAPHLGQVSTEIPSLSSNMSSLTSDGQSQRWYAQRLLCSGDDGFCVKPGVKSTIKQLGPSYYAGGRDLAARCNGITGSYWRRAGSAVSRQGSAGGFLSYKVPASAWFDLADGASSVLPLPYLTSSSSNLIVRVTWANVENAIVGKVRPSTVDQFSYVVAGVNLSYTAVNIIDSDVLGSIERLFRGQVSAPVPGTSVSIPVPMCLSFRKYRFASTTLPAATGQVTLRIPAGKAACNSILVKLDPIYQPSGTSVVGCKTGDYNVVGPKAMIRNMCIRVGSARFPARELTDIYTTPANLPAKYAGFVPSEADPLNAAVGGPTYVNTTDVRAAQMYKEGRGFFSFFDDDGFDASPIAELFETATGPTSVASRTRPSILVATSNAEDYSFTDSVHMATPIAGGLVAYEGSASPNLFVFNLQSYMPECSLRERGYAMTSIDLRNQADVSLEFEIFGSQVGGVQLLDRTGTADAYAPTLATAWNVSAAMQYIELATLLPSRCDIEASSSLISSSAGAVASGGGASGI